MFNNIWFIDSSVVEAHDISNMNIIMNIVFTVSQFVTKPSRISAEIRDGLVTKLRYSKTIFIFWGTEGDITTADADFQQSQMIQ